MLAIPLQFQLIEIFLRINNIFSNFRHYNSFACKIKPLITFGKQMERRFLRNA